MVSAKNAWNFYHSCCRRCRVVLFCSFLFSMKLNWNVEMNWNERKKRRKKCRRTYGSWVVYLYMDLMARVRSRHCNKSIPFLSFSCLRAYLFARECVYLCSNSCSWDVLFHSIEISRLRVNRNHAFMSLCLSYRSMLCIDTHAQIRALALTLVWLVQISKRGE